VGVVVNNAEKAAETLGMVGVVIGTCDEEAVTCEGGDWKFLGDMNEVDVDLDCRVCGESYD